MANMVSAQVNGRNFEIVKGVRYESEVKTTLTAGSLVGCAIKCVNEESCPDFNFASGQCELLSGAASCRTNATGWTMATTLQVNINLTTRGIF